MIARRISPRRRTSLPKAVLLLGIGAIGAALACSPGDSEYMKTGSQTNWLKQCTDESECGELSCLCGVCTSACDTDPTCPGLSGASCMRRSDAEAVAVCGGRAPEASLCLPLCGDTVCETGTSCVAGVCVPERSADTQVSVDMETRHQTLLGFGASLAYMDDEIASHPQKASLYDAMFADSGFEVVRFRNRFEGDNAEEFAAASEIIAAASERLGRTPTLIMTSGSPPAALKANASRTCGGDADTCTLTRTANGFDYDGLANHWRASLEASAAAGVSPDYLSFQNNPNWLPDASTTAEACHFLPEEGTTPVMVDGTMMDLSYPGYAQALAAVKAAIADLPAVPKLLGPEVTSPDLVATYTAPLAAGDYDVLAYHLYVDDPSAVDRQPYEQLKALAQQSGHPLFQTEMRAGGIDTAVLTHYSLSVADAAMYLQNDFASSANSLVEDPNALLDLTHDGFVVQEPYHALRHYAAHTEAGWQRVEATVADPDVLASAWRAPAGDALTLVLINPEPTPRNVALLLPAMVLESLDRTEVTRTVFEGTERSVVLGALPSNRVVSLPGRSIVTVAWRQ